MSTIRYTQNMKNYLFELKYFLCTIITLLQNDILKCTCLTIYVHFKECHSLHMLVDVCNIIAKNRFYEVD